MKNNKISTITRKKVSLNQDSKLLKIIQDNNIGVKFNIPYSMNSNYIKVPLPSWIKKDFENVKMSFIIPIQKCSFDCLIDSIARIIDINSKTGFLHEFILVVENDLDYQTVYKTFNYHQDKLNGINITMIHSNVEQGWGACCNAGSGVSVGEILVFINCGIDVQYMWTEDMYKISKRDGVGLLGGMHVDEKDIIIECGRKWVWDKNRFLKVGYELINGNIIEQPSAIYGESHDEKNFEGVQKNEYVNTDLSSIRKDVFEKIGGFSPQIKSKEWSDADFCMKLKEKKHTLYTSSNIVGFVKKHYIFNNDDKCDNVGKKLFVNKWISSGRIHDLVENKSVFNNNIEKIMIKRGNANGDVLVASSIAPALKKKYPKAKILFSTNCPEVLDKNPWIDQIVKIDDDRHVNLNINLNAVYEYNPKENFMQAYADEAGVPIEDCKLFINKKKVENLPENYVVIHAGKTLWAGRNWNTLKFDQLSSRIHNAGYKIVCVGSGYDHKTSHCDLNLINKTTISEMAYVIENAVTFVGIDSMPLIVSQIVKTKSVAFFGSIDPKTRIINEYLNPVFAEGIPCLGCHHRKPIPCFGTSTCEMDVQECITNVTVDHMWSEVKKTLPFS